MSVTDSLKCLHADQGGRELFPEYKEQQTTPHMGAQHGGGRTREEGLPITTTSGVRGRGGWWWRVHATGQNSGGIPRNRHTMVKGRISYIGRTQGGDVVPMEKKARILEIDDRSEGMRVQIMV